MAKQTDKKPVSQTPGSVRGKTMIATGLLRWQAVDALAAKISSTDALSYVDIGWPSFADYLGIKKSQYQTREHLPVVIARARLDLARAYLIERETHV